MHTKLRETNGYEQKRFRKRGSVVVNEDTNYLNETYLEIYKLFKNYSVNTLESNTKPKKLKIISKNRVELPKTKLKIVSNPPESSKTKLKIMKKLEFDGTELILEENSEKKLINNPLLSKYKTKIFKR